ncbi:MAG: inorganic phosphate transporter [Nitrospira sp.]
MDNSHILEQPYTSVASRLSFRVVFLSLLACGVGYAAYALLRDLTTVSHASTFAYGLLGLALAIALGFEFVNGFHDTANAVATVIYTHSLKPHAAVVWSGVWNFIGVLMSSGVVAFGIIALLPVELILQVGSQAGFAMVFALLFAAIMWNLGTWYFGLPASSSHTLIGSIIGVGLMNQLMQNSTGTTSGVDWAQATKIGYSLLLSPLTGFICAALLLLTVKHFVRDPSLYRSPEGNRPPPFWIRSLLILTCTGVSFAHGSNDGQKGMGLIMLILIGTVPAAYALNHAVPAAQLQAFVAESRAAADVVEKHLGAPISAAPLGDARGHVTDYLKTRELTSATLPALQQLTTGISQQVSRYETYTMVPEDLQGNIRNDMYLVSEMLRRMDKAGTPTFTEPDSAVLKSYKGHLDKATKFIPDWVKISVAIALGLGTMVGWKRIVITVGERIGKSHLTYAQGASAELVAMTTIGAADVFGLPVSTTQVLSSGVAGTMAANRSGLQWNTVRNLLMAWVLTLPMSVVLSGGLYWLFRQWQ